MSLLEAFSKLNRFFSPPSVNIGNFFYPLFYRVTFGILVAGCVLISLTQFFGKPIECISDPQSNNRKPFTDQFINTYCWIQSTFSLPSAWHKRIGVEIPYPGIDKTLPEDKPIVHAYYQWVVFVLFLQAVAFYLPHLIWKSYESGLVKKLIEGLKDVYGKDGTKRQKSIDDLAQYLVDIEHYENRLYYIYTFTEILHLINTIAQMFFMDKFLGGKFFDYGTDLWHYSQQDWINRTDPMIMLFPRVTKCTFRMFGESGDLEKHDTMCILPINILNEKIYIFLWVWFYFIAIIASLVVIYRLATFFMPPIRVYYIRWKCLSKVKGVRQVEERLTVGQWFLLTLILKNVDPMIGIQLVQKIKELLLKKHQSIEMNHYQPMIDNSGENNQHYPDDDDDDSLDDQKKDN